MIRLAKGPLISSLRCCRPGKAQERHHTQTVSQAILLGAALAHTERLVYLYSSSLGLSVTLEAMHCLSGWVDSQIPHASERTCSWVIPSGAASVHSVYLWAAYLFICP